MDLKKFYQKLREMEETISEEFPIVVTQETPDGGRAGQIVEVPRAVAARMVVEGHAKLAKDAELAAYRAGLELARQEALRKAAADKIQVKIVSGADLQSLAGSLTGVEKP